jgi:hypothetical protein
MNLKDAALNSDGRRDAWKNKRTANIESIKLMTQQDVWEKYGTPIPAHADGKPLALINFKFPCKYTTLGIAEMLEILKLWFIAEEMRYPTQIRHKGEYFFEEVKKVFQAAKVNTDERR